MTKNIKIEMKNIEKEKNNFLTYDCRLSVDCSITSIELTHVDGEMKGDF